jgi:hypothetical protein
MDSPGSGGDSPGSGGMIAGGINVIKNMFRGGDRNSGCGHNKRKGGTK